MLSPELTALRDEALQTSCDSWARQKRWKLSAGGERAGACPSCGGVDRFSINVRENLFNCRKCGIAGHGVIDLVMKTEGLEFIPACELITGRKAAAPVDEKRMAELRQKVLADERDRAAEAEKYREKSRRAGYEISRRASGVIIGGVVDRYLERRGISLKEIVTRDGRFVKIYEIEVLAWREEYLGPDGRKAFRTIHTGPAMIADVIRPDGHFGAVHQTWLDLDRPNGKLLLPPDDAGKPRPSKKVLGAKKGGAIRLFTPGQGTNTDPKPRRIVMGEGIETTLTALAHNFEPETAYWAGVDLGNMSGKAAKSADGGWLHDQPDMDGFIDPRSGEVRQPLGDPDCFLPPDWCEELVFLTDSDEAATHTLEKVTRGLRRAAALCKNLHSAWLVPPIGDGKDLNDLVRVEA